MQEAPCDEAGVNIDDDGMQRSRSEVQFQHLCVCRHDHHARDDSGHARVMPLLCMCSHGTKTEKSSERTHLAAVVQHDGEHVATADAFTAQERRQARGAAEQLQVCQCRVARGRRVDHGEAVRVVPRSCGEDVPGAPGDCHGRCMDTGVLDGAHDCLRVRLSPAAQICADHGAIEPSSVRIVSKGVICI